MRRFLEQSSTCPKKETKAAKQKYQAKSKGEVGGRNKYISASRETCHDELKDYWHTAIRFLDFHQA